MEIYTQSFLYNKVIEILRKYEQVYKEENYQAVVRLSSILERVL